MASNQRLMSIFDIMGPIMIGSSSSHTAGAVLIVRMVRMLFGTDPKSVDLYFYGSLAEIYRGHMTDAGVVAGILSMEVDNPPSRKPLKSLGSGESASASTHKPSRTRIQTRSKLR